MGKLSCIFISHMHGDHHAGLAVLLKRRAEVRSSITSQALHFPNSFTERNESTSHSDLPSQLQDLLV